MVEELSYTDLGEAMIAEVGLYECWERYGTVDTMYVGLEALAREDISPEGEVR